jgi:hypothetical protein
VGELAVYAAMPHMARRGRLAVPTNARAGIGKGTSVSIAGSAWLPRTTEAFPVRRRPQVAPSMPRQFSNGVPVDVCPGHRTWSPPV